MCGAGDFPGSCQTKSASSLSLCPARPPERCVSFCVEFVRLISLCACHLGPLACGLRGGGGFTRLSARGMRCLWHAPGGVWPAGASCNGFVTQWKVKGAHDLSHSSGLLAPAGRAVAQGCVRRCARQRGDHGSSRGTLSQSTQLLLSGQIASVRFNSAAPCGNLRLVLACQDARRSRLPVPAQQAGRGRRRAVLDSLIHFTQKLGNEWERSPQGRPADSLELAPLPRFPSKSSSSSVLP